MADPKDEKENSLDPKSFLLPNKEVHTPDSAQRQSAGVLLAQEELAAQEGIKPAAAPSPAPAPKAEPKKEEPETKAIQTYKSDVESMVGQKDVSVVSIAAAEAKKRERSPIAVAEAKEERWLLTRASLVVGGVFLVSIAGGALAYVLTRPRTVPVVPLSTQAPFITVDNTKQVSIDPTAQGTAIMNTLNTARSGVDISLGLIERLYVTTGSGTGAQEVPAATLLGALAPRVPQSLLRTLHGQYLLGVHSFDENQAFLILQTDSYQTAYAAMLEWEPTMKQDLLPLFARTPPVHENNANLSTQTTATTSAVGTSTTPREFFAGSSAPQSASGAAANEPPAAFIDRVVENHDARVIQTNQGDIVFLWTFLGHSTLVITTNENTLREILSRVSQTPTVSLPQ